MEFKLAICTPITWSHVPIQFLDSMLGMIKPNNHVFLHSGGFRLDHIRNQLAKAAITMNCTHILFLDNDHYFEADTIKKLLSHDLPIVGGLSFQRVPPYEPVMYRGRINEYKTVTEWKEKSLVEVDTTGTGCLMIKREVFEKIDPPWFEFMKNPDPNVPYGIGEDVIFCNKAKLEGYKIFVDTSCTNKHIGTVECDFDLYKNWKKIEE